MHNTNNTNDKDLDTFIAMSDRIINPKNKKVKKSITGYTTNDIIKTSINSAITVMDLLSIDESDENIHILAQAIRILESYK